MPFITNGTENVVLGSGNLYAIPISEVADVFNLTTAEEAELTYLGYIEANATLSAAIEKTEIKAANAGKVASPIKEKTVTFSTGIFSWNLENVSKFLTGSTYTTNATTGKTTFTYAHEDNIPNVYLRFVSTDESNNKKIVVNMFMCSFSGKLSFEFSNDKPITFDYSFDVLTKYNTTRKKNDYYTVTVENITEA